MGNICDCFRKSDTELNNHYQSDDYNENLCNSGNFQHRTKYGYAKDGVPLYQGINNGPSFKNERYTKKSDFQTPLAAAHINIHKDYTALNDGETPDFMFSSGYTQNSFSNLQHISEREPDGMFYVSVLHN